MHYRELRVFVVEQRMRSRQYQLPVVFSRHLLVHPVFQGQGIGTWLRIAYRQRIATEYPEGALLLSRILLDNQASMSTAQAVDHQPTDILDPSSAEPRQFWYGSSSHDSSNSNVHKDSPAGQPHLPTGWFYSLIGNVVVRSKPMEKLDREAYIALQVESSLAIGDPRSPQELADLAKRKLAFS
jgi:hypothetical protein